MKANFSIIENHNKYELYLFSKKETIPSQILYIFRIIMLCTNIYNK